MTRKLFEENSFQTEFTAVVTACEPIPDAYRILLDQTAFFPEGGGQSGDSGFLNQTEIFDTQEKEGLIWHCARAPFEPGTRVSGRIDWEKRFDRMQQHSGEHIVSGLVHSRFGYDNVGFHLGETEVTLDFNGPITKKELAEIEKKANQAIWANLPVEAACPSKEELALLDYRSKIEIQGQIRIITIPGIDICACCAPHVHCTGQIGLIKLTSVQAHRGGVRIHLQAGSRALADYTQKEQSVKSISVLLSSKEEDTPMAVERLKQENYALTGRILQLQKALIHQKASTVPETTGNIVFFEPDLDPDTAREFVNLLTRRCTGAACVFLGNDTDGYRYILGSIHEDVRPLCRELNNAFQGKGGGRPEMVQGSLMGNREAIESRLAGLIITSPPQPAPSR